MHVKGPDLTLLLEAALIYTHEGLRKGLMQPCPFKSPPMPALQASCARLETPMHGPGLEPAQVFRGRQGLLRGHCAGRRPDPGKTSTSSGFAVV